MEKAVVLSLIALLGVAESYVLPGNSQENATVTFTSNIFARDNDPTDFSWVKRWAAVGDSFTAGIGSGSPLGNPIKDDPGDSNWYCARYDTAYPMIINDALGPSVEDFQFKACSGDRTGGIYNQITGMEGDLDLVVMTAGGNDLCLSSMIKECVFMPFDGEDACQNVIDIAQDNLNSILKSNLVQLMDALNDKMNDGGIVVFNGYAQFFNTENEDCSTNQDWTLVNLWGQDGLKLTIERREAFNDLVVQINNVIEQVVKDTAADSKYKFKIGFSNWDIWPRKGVKGQFCDPSSTGVYPDDDQPELQFFKPSTNSDADALNELKRSEQAPAQSWEEYKKVQEELHKRQVAMEMELYRSRLTVSANPPTQAKRKLERRFPSRPNCPGDEDVDVQPPSIGLPNFIAKNFHPNELGHYTIASWALQTIMDLRADALGVDAPECEKTDEFKCYQSTGSKAYASESRLNDNYEDFCNSVTRPTGKSGWSYSKTYDKGTPDETEFTISLADTSTNYDKNECIESMSRVINSCDGNDPDNPMDWKFGGEWVRGDYTYQVKPQRTNRPWPVIQSASGSCKGWWHALFSSYTIKGAGFSDYDYGQKTLLPHAKSCIGGGLTAWKFEYFDEPDDDGYEWKATFNTPIWVRSRCFKNNKVVFEIGGFTDGCGGND